MNAHSWDQSTAKKMNGRTHLGVIYFQNPPPCWAWTALHEIKFGNLEGGESTRVVSRCDFEFA